MMIKNIFIIGFCMALNFGLKAQYYTHASFGSLQIMGDVDYVTDPLNSFHLSISRVLKHNLVTEIKLGFGKTVGLSGDPFYTDNLGGGLVEEVYDVIDNNPWYPNHLTNYGYFDLGLNYLLPIGNTRFRLMGGLGIGGSLSNTRINLVGLEEMKYDALYDPSIGLDQIKKSLNSRYDTSYETEFREGNSFNPHLSFQAGLHFRIGKGIYIAIEARFHRTNTDYLDPIKFSNSNIVTSNKDHVRMITFGFFGKIFQNTQSVESKQIVPNQQ